MHLGGFIHLCSLRIDLRSRPGWTLRKSACMQPVRRSENQYVTLTIDLAPSQKHLQSSWPSENRTFLLREINQRSEVGADTCMFIFGVNRLKESTGMLNMCVCLSPWLRSNDSSASLRMQRRMS